MKCFYVYLLKCEDESYYIGKGCEKRWEASMKRREGIKCLFKYYVDNEDEAFRVEDKIWVEMTKRSFKMRNKERPERYGRQDQRSGRKGGRKLTYKGLTLMTSEWVKKLGLPLDVINGRLKTGKSVAETFETPLKTSKKFTYLDRTLTINEWSVATKLSAGRIRQRLRMGWGIKDTLTIYDKRARGERHGNVRLTVEQVREIKKLRADKNYIWHNQDTLKFARMFEVSQSAITNIIYGITWKYV